jgi:hypothetical protein
LGDQVWVLHYETFQKTSETVYTND